MKPLLLLFPGLLATIAAAQNSPVVINQSTSDNGVVLKELGPPQRPGRRGGVYITGAPPLPTTSNATPIVITGTNQLPSYDVGGTGSVVQTNVGTSETVETIMPPEPIFIPNLNSPGVPGAIGGRGAIPGQTPAPTTPPPSNNGIVIPPTTPPAAIIGPTLPPSRIGTPPPGPGTLPGGTISSPPPITSPPPPITGPSTR